MAANTALKKQLDRLLAEVADSIKGAEQPAVDAPGGRQSAGGDLAGLFSDAIALNRAGEIAEPVDDQVQKPPSVTGSGRAQAELDVPPETHPAELPRSGRISQAKPARRALRSDHDQATIVPLLRVAADPNPEVARVALETLVKLGEVVKNYVLLLALQPRSPLHRGAEVYLSHILGQPVVHIPLGPFLMGSNPAVDELAELNEQPQHEVWLAGYWLGRYPVTVARFRAFVQASGFRPAKTDFKSGYENHPAVNVSWSEALAYCRWLKEQSGLEVTLPSEAEWEKGARGVDGRRFPWGNRPPTPELVNFNCATPVGDYSPQADSPFGCADMAGNAWEWTRSAYRPYPYDPGDGREEPGGNQVRVVRGLTFNNPPQLTRCSYRYRLQPQLRLPSLGFRIAVSPP